MTHTVVHQNPHDETVSNDHEIIEAILNRLKLDMLLNVDGLTNQNRSEMGYNLTVQ